MSTFKTCVRVVAAHRLYILIYLVVLSLFGLFTGMAKSEDSSDEVTVATASVAVIDRDGSTISRGVKGYVESVGEARAEATAGGPRGLRAAPHGHGHRV